MKIKDTFEVSAEVSIFTYVFELAYIVRHLFVYNLQKGENYLLS